MKYQATINQLRKLDAELPETISLDDVKNHEWLRDLMLVCDALSNKIDYRALEWIKTQGYSNWQNNS